MDADWQALLAAQVATMRAEFAAYAAQHGDACWMPGCGAKAPPRGSPDRTEATLYGVPVVLCAGCARGVGDVLDLARGVQIMGVVIQRVRSGAAAPLVGRLLQFALKLRKPRGR